MNYKAFALGPFQAAVAQQSKPGVSPLPTLNLLMNGFSGSITGVKALEELRRAVEFALDPVDNGQQ